MEEPQPCEQLVTSGTLEARLRRYAAVLKKPGWLLAGAWADSGRIGSLGHGTVELWCSISTEKETELGVGVASMVSEE